MGSNLAKFCAGAKESGQGADDVKRQVDSDVSNQRAIYQLVDVKTGGGKLIELVKLRARRRSVVNSSASSASGSAGALESARGREHDKEDDELDEEIRRLVEPLLYNRGQGKLVPLYRLWRARFGMEQPTGGEDHESELQRRLVCWKLEERGFVGETALHICFLLSTPSHMILAKKLLRLFPKLINDIYLCDEYFGESCLHMAIVNENVSMVKWLLERDAQVDARCLGSFFLPLDQKDSRATNQRLRRLLASSTSEEIGKQKGDPVEWDSNEFAPAAVARTNYDGYCYWGEYALSFAASLGLADCYRLLLACGADPNRRDSNGNTALHLCVIANRADMFDLCYATGAQLNLRNKQHLSPLTLAAKLQRVEMLFHILTIERQVDWIFCQVCFQRIPLDGLDSINTREGSYDEHSLLAIVVSGTSTAHLAMLDGLLGELLQVKWRTCIELKFKTWFRLYLLFLLLSSFVYMTRLAAPSLQRARHLSELALLLSVFAYLSILARRCLDSERVDSHTAASRWQLLVEAPELTMFTFTCLLILLCLPVRLLAFGDRGPEFEDTLAALIMFLLPMKLLFFCRASPTLGSFIVMIYKILVNDVLCFVVFLVIFVAGFSQSFFIIFKTHQAENNQLTGDKNYFGNLFEGVIAMHMMALNEFSIVVDQFDSTDFPLLARLLFCIYMILVSILLINMLIAMLGKTYQEISSQPNESLRQWARALLTVERMCSRSERLRMLDEYSQRQTSSDARRCYNSTWALQDDQLQQIELVKQLRHDNQRNLAALQRGRQFIETKTSNKDQAAGMGEI